MTPRVTTEISCRITHTLCFANAPRNRSSASRLPWGARLLSGGLALRRGAPAGRAGAGRFHVSVPHAWIGMRIPHLTARAGVRSPGILRPQPGPTIAMRRFQCDSRRRAMPKAAAETAEIAGITLTHPDRVLWPKQGVTKSGLAEYYVGIADRILPHVVNRP